LTSDTLTGALPMPRDATLPRSSFLILLTLAERPRHGLGIVEDVEDASGGEVRLGPGTLYGTLQRLVQEGLIRQTTDAPDPDDDDPRRRYYRLTPRGERALRDEASRLRTLVDAAARRHILQDRK
jgi:DNA-binding PadR family transcriptional regulator